MQTFNEINIIIFAWLIYFDEIKSVNVICYLLTLYFIKHNKCGSRRVVPNSGASKNLYLNINSTLTLYENIKRT